MPLIVILYVPLCFCSSLFCVVVVFNEVRYEFPNIVNAVLLSEEVSSTGTSIFMFLSMAPPPRQGPFAADSLRFYRLWSAPPQRNGVTPQPEDEIEIEFLRLVPRIYAGYNQPQGRTVPEIGPGFGIPAVALAFGDFGIAVPGKVNQKPSLINTKIVHGPGFTRHVGGF